MGSKDWSVADEAVGNRHVIEAVPLEQDLAGGDVDLLRDAVDHLTVGGSADRREVVGHGLVDGDQCCSLWGEAELVLVGGESVAGLDDRDLLVVLVEDHILACAVTGAAPDCLADVEGEDELAAVLLDAEIGRLVGEGDREEEERPALVVDDLGALLTGDAGPCDLRRDEDQARIEVRLAFQHRDRRRSELRGVGAADPRDRRVGSGQRPPERIARASSIVCGEPRRGGWPGGRSRACGGRTGSQYSTHREKCRTPGNDAHGAPQSRRPATC